MRSKSRLVRNTNVIYYYTAALSYLQQWPIQAVYKSFWAGRSRPDPLAGQTWWRPNLKSIWRKTMPIRPRIAGKKLWFCFHVKIFPFLFWRIFNGFLCKRQNKNKIPATIGKLTQKWINMFMIGMKYFIFFIWIFLCVIRLCNRYEYNMKSNVSKFFDENGCPF